MCENYNDQLKIVKDSIRWHKLRGVRVIETDDKRKQIKGQYSQITILRERGVSELEFWPAMSTVCTDCGRFEIWCSVRPESDGLYILKMYRQSY